MNLTKFLSIIVATLMIVSVYGEEEAESVKVTQCYVCNSNEDSSCNDVYQPQQNHIQDCTNGETFCRKMIQTVHGETSIVRQCAKELKEADFEGCYKTAGKSTQNVCTCKAENGNPCNSGFVVKSSMFSIALTALVAKFFF